MTGRLQGNLEVEEAVRVGLGGQGGRQVRRETGEMETGVEKQVRM